MGRAFYEARLFCANYQLTARELQTGRLVGEGESSKILGNDMRVGRVLSEKLRTLEDGGRGKLIACVRGNRGGGPT